MSTNGQWKPFLLGVLSASVTYWALRSWQSDDYDDRHGISCLETDQEDSSSSDSDIRTHDQPDHSTRDTKESWYHPENPRTAFTISQKTFWDHVSRFYTTTTRAFPRPNKKRRRRTSKRRTMQNSHNRNHSNEDEATNLNHHLELLQQPTQTWIPTFLRYATWTWITHLHPRMLLESCNHLLPMTSSSGEDITSDPNVHNAEKSGLCIGSIFGLDVGGTLAKLVYFEKHEHTRHGQEYDTGKEPRVHIHSKVGTQDSHSNEDLTKLLRARQASLPDALIQFHEQDSNKYDDIDQMRKSKSMFNLVDGDERAIALSKFYTFAKNLDSYASGVKENDLSFYSRALGGEFHFIQFETRQMPVALELIRISSFHRNILHIGATGGGAHRFSNEFEQILGIKMVKQDELDSMVAGLQFALRDCPNECYTFVPDEDAMRRSESGSNESLIENVESSPAANDLEDSLVTSHRPPRRRWRDSDQYWWSKKELRDSSSTAKQYPYLLVMIGTGVSILRVDGPRKHERISGSTIGGGTYWGLCRLLTDAEDFQSALELAKRGDATKVDMLVGDIYGPNSGALEKLGLSANIVASSFGKLVSKQSPAEGLSQMDLARALLLMVTNNIGQVALLNARLHNTQRIYFIGNFLRHNIISQQRLAFSLAYWSKGKMEALFLEHEGYFGSLGAFLLSQGINTSKLPSSVSSDPRREFKSTRDIKHVRRYRARSI